MVTRQELEGQWNQVKGKLQERWASLTDDELQRVKGNATELVGVIQQRTGETRRAVEDFLATAVKDGSGRAQQAVDSAREYADHAMHAAKDAYGEASAQLSSGMHQAQQVVRQKPMESVAVAFGAGLMAGIIAGLMLKSNR